MARAGAAEGTWLRADTQSGGRGRQGRIWTSPPGNFYGSTLIRPRPGDPAPATLGFVTAVALDQVISARLGDAALLIKWPNDLLVNGAKLSGILLERVDEAIIVGLGVNLAHHPEGLDRPTISLAVCGVAVPAPADFLVDLAAAFAHWVARWRSEGFGVIRQRWLGRAHPIGTALAVSLPDGSRLEGLFEGIDSDGALNLRLASGALHVMHAGDVFLI